MCLDYLHAIVAGCAMSTAASTNNNSNIDDILALARKFPQNDRKLASSKPFYACRADRLGVQNSLLSG
jgi:hypothetical protein